MMDFAMELSSFMRAHWKYWVIPILFTMAVFGGLIILASWSPVAPSHIDGDAIGLVLR